MIRVAIVDDQPLFASGVKMLINAQPDMTCVGTASDGRMALALNLKTRPDVILMDLRMPGMSGLDATKAIAEKSASGSPPAIVVLTTIQKDEAVFSALRAGASSFVTKDVTPQDLLATVRDAADGIGSAAGEETVGLVRTFGHRGDAEKPRDLTDALSAREKDVFLLIARGMSNLQIAEVLHLTEATAKSHVRAVLQKLNLRSRIQVVIFAYENGLTDSVS